MFGVTDRLIEHLKQQEGWVPHVYMDQAGFPTIGYGHLLKSVDHEPISLEEGEGLLRKDVSIAAADAVRISPNLKHCDENKVAAIIDFIFNLGSGNYSVSTFRKKVEAEDWEGAAAENRKWVYARVNGVKKQLSALIKRRAITSAWLLE